MDQVNVYLKIVQMTSQMRLKTLRVKRFYVLVSIAALAAFLIIRNSSSASLEFSSDVNKITYKELLTKQYEEISVKYVIPKNVFYFWCGPKRFFEHRHYLSVRSVFRYLRPYSVVFYQEIEPIKDDDGYHTWLSEIEQQYPFFSRENLPLGWCKNYRENVDRFLFKHGGIYIQENVILSSQSLEYFRLLKHVTVNDISRNRTLVQMSARGYADSTNNQQPLHTHPVKLIRGAPRIELSQVEAGSIQMLPGYKTTGKLLENNNPINNDDVLMFIADSEVVPESIWELESETGRLLRSVAYGRSELARPVPDFGRLSPNIAHVICNLYKPMGFTFYLCVLSLLELASVDRLYIHCDGSPGGQYWDLVKSHPKLQLVHRTLVRHQLERIYGNKVRVIQHIADVWRLDILHRYGGLYVDTDAIFFRPLSPEIRAYDAVLSPDISEKRGSFPGNYQNGIMLGRRGAEFWRRQIDSMKVYNDSDFLWNCNFNMYKIKERHPNLVRVEPRLNTMCYQSKCYPSWIPDFKVKMGKISTDITTLWRNNTFAIHHTFPDLPEFNSYRTLLKNNGTTFFGAVGLFVLEQAGKLDFFKKLMEQEDQSFRF